jgi:hypothetical protein
MPVNRYELPAQQQLANTYVGLPYQELLLAGQSMQKQYDDIESKRLEWADKRFNFLNPDEERAKSGYNWLQSETEKIADSWTNNPLEARKNYMAFEREAKKKFDPNFGEYGKIESNYNSFMQALTYEEERAKKEGVSQEQIKAWKQKTIADYAAQGGIGDNAENWQNLNYERLSDYMSATEFADKYAKGAASDMSSWATVDLGADGQFIVKDKGSKEVITRERLNELLVNYYQGDPKMKAYIEQGSRYGYASLDEYNQAMLGAIYKYQSKKTTSDKDMSPNSNWGRALDEKAKVESIIPIPLPPVVADEKLDNSEWGIFSRVNNLTNNLQKQQNDYAAQQENITVQMRDAEKVANDPLATPASKRDAGLRLQSLAQQQESLYNEQMSQSQIYNEFVDAAFAQDGITAGGVQKYNTMGKLISTSDNIDKELSEINKAISQAKGEVKTQSRVESAKEQQNVVYNLENKKQQLINQKLQIYGQLYTEVTGEQVPQINNLSDITKLKVNPYTKAKATVNKATEALANYDKNRVTQGTAVYIAGNPNSPQYKQVSNYILDNPDLWKTEVLDNATGKYVTKKSTLSTWGIPTEETRQVVDDIPEQNAVIVAVKDKSGKVIRQEKLTHKGDASEFDKMMYSFYQSSDPSGINPTTEMAKLKHLPETKAVLEQVNKAIEMGAGATTKSTQDLMLPPIQLTSGAYLVPEIDNQKVGNKHYNVKLMIPVADNAGNVNLEERSMIMDDGTPLSTTGLTDEQFKNIAVLLESELK